MIGSIITALLFLGACGLLGSALIMTLEQGGPDHFA